MFRRSASVHVSSGGGSRISGGSNSSNGCPVGAGAGAYRDARPRQLPQLQRRRKHSLGSCAAAAAATETPQMRSPLAPAPEVKILSVGDFCSAPSAALKMKRRRRSPFRRLSLNQFTPGGGAAAAAAAAASSAAIPRAGLPSPRAAEKYRFVEWSDSEEDRWQEEEEEKEEEVVERRRREEDDGKEEATDRKGEACDEEEEEEEAFVKQEKLPVVRKRWMEDVQETPV